MLLRRARSLCKQRGIGGSVPFCRCDYPYLRGAMIATISSLRIPLPLAQIASFCRRWNIARLEVFGSALRDDFRPDSDVDFLATYAPEARWSLLDRVRMKFELEAMLGREVDLLNRRALEKARTHARAAAILAQAEPLYVEARLTMMNCGGSSSATFRT